MFHMLDHQLKRLTARSLREYARSTPSNKVGRRKNIAEALSSD